MTEEPKSQGWWHTVPGILTATAGIVTALAGLIVALNQTGAPEKPPLLNDGSSKVHTVKELPANSRDWFDTGIDVASGQLLEITASGQINLIGTRGETIIGPDGNPHILCDYPSCVDQGQPAGKLYGKIGNYQFSIGSNTTFNVANGGRLQMKVNDHFFDDNNGKFRVTVELR